MLDDFTNPPDSLHNEPEPTGTRVIGSHGAMPLPIEMIYPSGVKLSPIYSTLGRPLVYKAYLLNLLYTGQLASASEQSAEVLELIATAYNASGSIATIDQKDEITQKSLAIDDQVSTARYNCQTFAQLRKTLGVKDTYLELLEAIGIPQSQISKWAEQTAEMAKLMSEILFPIGVRYAPVSPNNITRVIRDFITEGNNQRELAIEFDNQSLTHVATWMRTGLEVVTANSPMILDEDFSFNPTETAKAVMAQKYKILLVCKADLVMYLLRYYFSECLLECILNRAEHVIKEVKNKLERSFGVEQDHLVAAYRSDKLDEAIYKFLAANHNIFSYYTIRKLAGVLFIAGYKAIEYVPEEVLPPRADILCNRIKALEKDLLISTVVHAAGEDDVISSRIKIAIADRSPTTEYVQDLEGLILEELRLASPAELARLRQKYPVVIDKVLEQLADDDSTQPSQMRPLTRSQRYRPGKKQKLKQRKLEADPELKSVESNGSINATQLVTQRVIFIVDGNAFTISAESKSALDQEIIAQILAPLGREQDKTMKEKIKQTAINLARGKRVPYDNSTAGEGTKFLNSYRIRFGPRNAYRMVYTIINGYVILKLLYKPDSRESDAGITKAEADLAMTKLNIHES